MDKRLFLTVSVCMGILLFWQIFIIPPQPKNKIQPQSARVLPANALQNTAALLPSSLPASGSLPVVEVKEQHLLFENEVISSTVSNQGGALVSLLLKDYKQGGKHRKDGKMPIELVASHKQVQGKTAVLKIDGQEVLFNNMVSFSDHVEMVSSMGALKINAGWYYQPHAYELHMKGSITNVSNQKTNFELQYAMEALHDETLQKNQSMFEPPPDLVTPLFLSQGVLVKHPFLDKKSLGKIAPIQFAGIDKQFFLTAVAPLHAPAQEVKFTEIPITQESGLYRVGATLITPVSNLEQQQSFNFDFLVYTGPKVSALLSASHVGFDEAIDYNIWGMPMSFLTKPMLWILNMAYRLFHSYGLAIIFLTLIVKVLTLPITQKSYVSMQKMKTLQPEIEKIKQRFPQDRNQQGLEQMKLYRERGVNPFLSGCLPALFQMPIYLALWRTLYSAVELYQQEFLWLPDLTAKDPFYVLPLVYGATMFVQQKLSPPMGGDPQQAKMMLYMMPVLMTVFFINFASGLTLYVLVNTLLTIAQQTYINKKFATK